MSYSDNYKLLLKTDETDIKKIISSYTTNINSKLNNKLFQAPNEVVLPEPAEITNVNKINEPETSNYLQVAGESSVIDSDTTNSAYEIEELVSGIQPDEQPIQPQPQPQETTEPNHPDFGNNELNDFFNGLSTKSQNMILGLKNNDQPIVLTKLLNQQKEKIGTIIQQIKTQVEPDIDILKVDETSNESMNESDNENSNETNNNSESSETKQIKLN
jgi:hypothetical protein